ncbi:MAG: AAA family ATPase [Deltaproteobacteria bacterium]|nr:AAA family ATPase [Deltaproteobacteria bacterium]
MCESAFLRIQRIEVEQLFGRYDHFIDLNRKERVTILHGPNGVGKTTLFRMVRSLVSLQLWTLAKTPFHRLRLKLSDGSTLSVSPEKESDPDGWALTLSLSQPHQNEQSTTLTADDLSEKVLGQLDRGLPWLKRIKRETWLDMDAGEELALDEVLARYSATQIGVLPLFDGNDWLLRFVEQVHVHFIETQRLVGISASQLEDVRFRRSQVRARTPSSVHTINAYAKDLASRIRTTMASYGQTSQELDQSFPQRLLTMTSENSVELENLKTTMLNLETQREGLKSIGLLDKTETNPFDPNTLDESDPTQIKVMALYAQDAAKKLERMEELARKTRHLLDSVNKRFRHKTIRIDRKEGIVVEEESGRRLPFDALSSGEQHELVMNYDLLFLVKPNTLVLIDEPELSLHVVWQKAFLNDLLETVDIADCDTLLATHSPYIVGDHDELLVDLSDARS